MKNTRSHLIFGFFLISFGIIWLIANITENRIGWNFLGPGILMAVGISFFASIKNQQTAGSVFPGTLFFLTGLALFLKNFDFFYDFMYNIQIHTAILLLLGCAFLVLFIVRRELGLLVPTTILITLGMLFLLNDFWILDRNLIEKFWPLIPIGIGIFIIFQGLRKQKRNHQHSTDSV
jgi:hypothetical protein